MVVQHNLTAMNSNRMLGITQGAQAKSSEKLSSGYQINRAADDAAGLSISEKMRKQINGLDRASTNAQDGVSAVQTAEGALTEVHSMLQRMNELAVQAANGTNSLDDRTAIQNEIEQLTTEIDRVAETTKFNETYLLKGNGKTTTVKIDAKDAGIEGKLAGVGTGTATFTMDALKTGEQIVIGSKGYTIGTAVEEIQSAITDDTEAGDKVTIDGTTYTVSGDGYPVDDTENVLAAEEIAGLVSDGAKVLVGANSYVAMVDGSGGTYKSADEAKALLDNLNDGDKVTIDGTEYTYDANGGTLAAAKEVNMTSTTAKILDAIDGKTPANGDKIAVGDVEFTVGATGTLDHDAAPPVVTGTWEEIKDYINDAANNNLTVTDGTTIKFTDTSASTDVTYTIGAEADIVETAVAADTTGNKDAISALLTDGVEAIIGGETFTVGTAPADAVVADGVADNDASVISKEKAYELIANELAAAGSVGTDPGSEATIIANDEGKNFTIDGDKVSFQIQEGEVETTQGLQFTLHVGADADENNKIALTVDAMDSTSLGVSGINVVDDTGAKATYAIDAIADAVSKVSAQRSALGAIQNRLEHTIANLDNVVENTTAAESRIRDTDMAEEMVEYSKNNILAQAGQSMLAQANQSNQGVLAILG